MGLLVLEVLDDRRLSVSGRCLRIPLVERISTHSGTSEMQFKDPEVTEIAEESVTISHVADYPCFIKPSNHPINRMLAPDSSGELGIRMQSSD